MPPNQSVHQPCYVGPPPVWRRLFHLTAGSSVPLAGIFGPEGPLVVALAVLAAGGLTLELARFRVAWLNQRLLRWLWLVLKEQEERRITGATYMLIGAFLAFLFFDAGVAVAALLFLSLGDPAAALVGRRMPGLRFSGKSPGGTAAFVAVALLVVAVLTVSGVVEYHWALLAGAAVAGLVELLPLPPDDNLTIPLASGAAMHFIPLASGA